MPKKSSRPQLVELKPAPREITDEELDLRTQHEKPRYTLIAWGFDGEVDYSYEMPVEHYIEMKRFLAQLRGYKVSTVR